MAIDEIGLEGGTHANTQKYLRRFNLFKEILPVFWSSSSTEKRPVRNRDFATLAYACGLSDAGREPISAANPVDMPRASLGSIRLARRQPILHRVCGAI